MVNKGVITIPTADLSPFLKELEESAYSYDADDEDDQKKKKKKDAIEIIGKACSEFGFFQVVNHGVPLHLMQKALLLSNQFFGYPLDRKLQASPLTGAPLPAGYGRQPDRSPDKNEFFMMFPPHSTFNVFPSDPQGFRFFFSLLLSLCYIISIIICFHSNSSIYILSIFNNHSISFLFGFDVYVRVYFHL